MSVNKLSPEFAAPAAWPPEIGLEPYYQDDLRVIYCGDCREVLTRLAAFGVLGTAVVTDPPYQIQFMGRSWDSDGVSFQKETWDIVRSACRPGAPLLSFAGTRTQHRIACAIEDAGWEIRDCVMWVFGSGFPKSLDISKAIDKMRGAERKVVGSKVGMPGYSLKHQGAGGVLAGRADGSLDNSEGECAVTAPSTPEAKLWDGWGSALKPAYEPVLLAMNPVDKTFANNALVHGVAGLNIDGCRIEGAKGSGVWGTSNATVNPDRKFNASPGRPEYRSQQHPQGRFPANLILDEEAAAVLDAQSGVSGNGSGVTHKALPGQQPFKVSRGWNQHSMTRDGATAPDNYGDRGGASRFYYCAKASRSERDKGCDSGGRNTHPTIKPLTLMTYLCKLVTMPYCNLILDPFCGSGTTLLACGSLGVRSIGIDSDPQSCEITANRCATDTVERIRRGEG